MAILAINNYFTYHVETLSDLTGLGSTNSNVTGDTVAWVESTKNWYYPATIASVTSTWAVVTGYQISGDVGSVPVQNSLVNGQTLTPGTSNAVVAIVGVLDTNGQNMKVVLKATGVDIDTNFIAYTYEQYFYRSAGVVNSVAAFIDSTNAVGAAEFTAQVSFNVTATGNDIEFRVSNGSSTDTYSLDITAMWDAQEGGF